MARASMHDLVHKLVLVHVQQQEAAAEARRQTHTLKLQSTLAALADAERDTAGDVYNVRRLQALRREVRQLQDALPTFAFDKEQCLAECEPFLQAARALPRVQLNASWNSMIEKDLSGRKIESTAIVAKSSQELLLLNFLSQVRRHPVSQIVNQDVCSACGAELQLDTAHGQLLCVECGVVVPYVNTTMGIVSFEERDEKHGSHVGYKPQLYILKQLNNAANRGRLPDLEGKYYEAVASHLHHFMKVPLPQLHSITPTQFYTALRSICDKNNVVAKVEKHLTPQFHAKFTGIDPPEIDVVALESMCVILTKMVNLWRADRSVDTINTSYPWYNMSIYELFALHGYADYARTYFVQVDPEKLRAERPNLHSLMLRTGCKLPTAKFVFDQ